MPVTLRHNIMFRSLRMFSPHLLAVRGGSGRWRGRERWTGVRTASCKALVHDSFGQPEKVVKVQEHPVDELGSEDVAIEMIACPINPSDINIIQGVYPFKPALPAVGGGEGVGVVRERGEGVKGMEIGDWVVPAGALLGTWRSRIVAPSRRFLKVSSALPVAVAATIAVNPPTAYRMMKDFVDLQPGDCVIQNGGNSGVGLSVIQLAAAWGLHCISVIRDRPNLDELVSQMKALGASEVVTEEFAASHKMKDLVANYKQPRLAFNTIGGKSSTTLLKHLGDKGVMVNYGGMAKQPVTIPVSYLIFKNVKIVGYWNGKWLEHNLHNEKHCTMMGELNQLAISGKLKAPPNTQYPLSDYQTALTRAMEPYVGSKQIILMNE